MRVCVFGAGAVGGHVAVRLLTAAAADISIVARGPLLAAIRERGLILRSGGQEYTAKPAVATDDPATLPPQDLVIVTVKLNTLPALAESLARLIAPQGCALFLLNGIPWWWRYGLPGEGGPLPLIDPQARLWTVLGPGRALGCVIYSPNDMVEPGVIEHAGHSRFVMGEPDRSVSARLRSAVELFCRGGLEAEVSPDLRREILRKLVINAACNPLSALTRLPVGEMTADPELSALMLSVARETIAVSAGIGWDIASEVDLGAIGKRPSGKPLRTSMLQDVIMQRPLEIESQLGQVQAFAREAGVPVPTIDVVLPLVRGLDRSLRKS
jgi:2-dehydropantoate 2-reductase